MTIAVLHGVTVEDTRRLPAMLQVAATLITGIRRNQHITATVRDTPHGLPSPIRVIYNSAWMAFNCARGQANTENSFIWKLLDIGAL